MQAYKGNMPDTRDAIVIRRNVLFFALFVPMAYFGISFPISVLLGMNPYTVYYVFDGYNFAPLMIVLALNSILLLTTFAMRTMIPEYIILPRQDSAWLLIVFFGMLTVIFNYGNSGLDRSAIKENSNLLSTLATSLSYAGLAGLLLVNKKPLKLVVLGGLLIFSAAYAFERELILYLAVPIMLRISENPKHTVVFLVLGILFAIFIGGYKYILIMSKLNGFSFDLLTNPDLWQRISSSLLSDNLHKAGLEVYYFAGVAPDYTYGSLLLPVQFTRLLDPGAMSNGNLATEFYSGNNVGTGFSILLESWLNFGVFGVIIFPIFLFLVARYFAIMRSPILLVTFIIFSLKLQRSDFWPVIISILGLPVAAVFLGRLLWPDTTRTSSQPKKC